MAFVQIKRNPTRLYLGRGENKRHLHHGADGVVLIIVGLVLILTDLRDFPWRFINDYEAYE